MATLSFPDNTQPPADANPSRKRFKINESRWTNAMDDSERNVFKGRISGPAACPNCAHLLAGPEPALPASQTTDTPVTPFASDSVDDIVDDEEGGVLLEPVDVHHAYELDSHELLPEPEPMHSRLIGGEPFAFDLDANLSGDSIPISLPGGVNVQYLQLPFPLAPRATEVPEVGPPAATIPNLSIFLANNFDNHHDSQLTAFPGYVDAAATASDLLSTLNTSDLPVHSSFVSDGAALVGATDGPFTNYTFLAENAFPVDDPQRSYDFNEFLSDWRFRSGRDDRIPHLRPDAIDALGNHDWPDLVFKDALSIEPVDPQGIQWRQLGPRREEAVRVRRLMHPSTVLRASAQPSFTCAWSMRETIEDMQYGFRSFSSQHRPHFNHYQLRNNLVATSRNDIYHIADKNVQRTSLVCPGYQESILKCSELSGDCLLSCLAATARNREFMDYSSDDVLIAGGFNGEYVVVNPNSHSHVAGLVNHAEDGLVTHVHAFSDRRSGLTKAAFSSNDLKLRIMDLATTQFTECFDYKNAINCAATSPDGRLRALVGDSNDALIASAETGDIIISLQQHRDYGFACAWSTSGRYLATGSQDHTIAVWDARNWSKPVHVLDSVMSSAGSLYFADDGELIIAENDDVVSICDRTTFQRTQNLEFFGPITGVALLDGGREIVIGVADKTVGGILAYERIAGGSCGPFAQRRGTRNTSPDIEFAFI